MDAGAVAMPPAALWNANRRSMLMEHSAPTEVLKRRLAGEAVVLVELGLSIPLLPLKTRLNPQASPIDHRDDGAGLR